MSTRVKVISFVFILLLMASAAAAYFLMPKEDVYAYRGGYHNASSFHLTAGVTVKKVDDNGNDLSGAGIRITTQRYNEQGQLFTDSSSNESIGSCTISNSYLDKDNGDNVFSYDKENEAIITIEETAAPDGYKELSSPIKLKYYYKNINPNSSESDYFAGDISSGNDQPIYYLMVDVLEDPENVVTVESGTQTDYYNNECPYYIIKIKNNPKKGNLVINNKVEGSAADKDKLFKFTVTLKDKNGASLANTKFGDDYETNGEGQITLNLKHGDSATIEGLPDKAQYTVVEDDYSSDGYSSSWSNEAGSTIEKPNDAINGDHPAKTISYTATNTKNSISVTPSFKKALAGDTPDTPENFTYTLTAVSNNADINKNDMPMPEGATDGVATLTKEGPGDYAFGNISFTKEGIYVYGLAEEKGTAEGYTYDTSKYTLTYNVVKNNDTGKLTCTETTTDDSGTVVDTCTFTNTYKKPANPDPVYKPVGVSLPLEKEITGDTPDKASSFKFIMKAFSINGDDPAQDMPMPDGATNGELNLDMEIPAGETLGEGNFGDITFNEPGKYVYEISEDDSGATGYTYDTAKYRVMWDVKAGVDDVLEAEMTIADENGAIVDSGQIKFTNKFEKEEENTDPEPVIIDPPLQKLVTGDEPMDPGSFTFVMRAVSNTAGYEVADMPMPEGAKDGVARHTVEGPGSYEFGEYTITRPGHYVYSLNEENTGEEGYTYDTTRYTISWNITEVDGKLVAEKTIADEDGKLVEAATFTNNYSYDNSPLDPDDNDSDVIDETDKTQKTIKKATVKTKAAKTGDLSALTYTYALLIASLLAGIALRRRAN